MPQPPPLYIISFSEAKFLKDSESGDAAATTTESETAASAMPTGKSGAERKGTSAYSALAVFAVVLGMIGL
jgi:hypothetical protein